MCVCVCVCVSCSVASDSATPWTVAGQAPLSMEFPRQEYWNRQTFPSPGDLPDPGITPGSPVICVYIYIYIYTHTHTHIYVTFVIGALYDD